MHDARHIPALLTLSLCISLMACRNPEPAATPPPMEPEVQTFMAALTIFCEPLSEKLLNTPEEAFTQTILDHWRARISSTEALELIDELTDEDTVNPSESLDRALARARITSCPVRAQLFDEEAPDSPAVSASEMSSTIRQTVQTNLAAIRTCYSAELLDDPSFDGRLKLGFTINAQGAVSEVSVQYDTQISPSDALTTCLYNEVLSWTFPIPPTPPMKVSIPLNFKP